MKRTAKTPIRARHPQFAKLDGNDKVLPDDADFKLVRGILLRQVNVIVAPRELTNGKGANHTDAVALAAKTRIGNRKWRAPEVHEAFCIPDRTKYNPAINLDFFPFLKGASWMWTATPDASDPADCAWFVGFYYGYAYLVDRGGHGYVLAVRGGVPSPGQ